MLTLFRLSTTLDWLLADVVMRQQARRRARQSVSKHGSAAIDHLLGKLNDPRRRRSRRELRLAVAEAIRLSDAA